MLKNHVYILEFYLFELNIQNLELLHIQVNFESDIWLLQNYLKTPVMYTDVDIATAT
jgi:hypothetical protein